MVLLGKSLEAKTTNHMFEPFVLPTTAFEPRLFLQAESDQLVRTQS